MWRANTLEKTQKMLGKIEGRRRRGRQRMRWLDGITDSMVMGLGGLGSWWWRGRPGLLRFMGSQRVGHDWVTELNWKQLKVGWGEVYTWHVWPNARGKEFGFSGCEGTERCIQYLCCCMWVSNSNPRCPRSKPELRQAPYPPGLRLCLLKSTISLDSLPCLPPPPIQSTANPVCSASECFGFKVSSQLSLERW